MARRFDKGSGSGITGPIRVYSPLWEHFRDGQSYTYLNGEDRNYIW